MAKALYVVPFIFAFGSLLDESIIEILFDFVVLLCFFSLMPMAVEGYFTMKLSAMERSILSVGAIGFLVSALGPMTQGLAWFALAFAIASCVLLRVTRRTGKANIAVATGYASERVLPGQKN